MRIAVCDNESMAADILLQKIYDITRSAHIQKFTTIQQFWDVIEEGGLFMLFLWILIGSNPLME